MTKFQGIQSPIPEPPITLDHDPVRDTWALTIHDGLGGTRSAVLPQEVVDRLAEQVVKPQPAETTETEWGIRWVEDPDTVENMRGDQTRVFEKASPKHGDVIVTRQVIRFRPQYGPWTPWAS